MSLLTPEDRRLARRCMDGPTVCRWCKTPTARPPDLPPHIPVQSCHKLECRARDREYEMDLITRTRGEEAPIQSPLLN